MSNAVCTIDVEQHCGVPLPSGRRCAGALTCRRHGMSSKRAVPGRSMPFDMLLHAYQQTTTVALSNNDRTEMGLGSPGDAPSAGGQEQSGTGS